MVIKSLTITEEAYNRLKAMKMGSESFSEAIIRISNNRVGAAAKFFGAFKGTDMEAFKKRIYERRKEIDKETRARMQKIRERLSE